jgi:hypothetical protein
VVAIHAIQKSRWNPSAIGDSIQSALSNARWSTGVMVVLHEGHPIGLVCGSGDGLRAKYTPITYRQWCGFSKYADLNTASKNGKEAWIYFQKTLSGFTGSVQWADAWPCGGNPVSGTYPGSAATARQLDNTTTGAMWLNQRLPGAGETRHLASWVLGHINGAGACVRSYIIYDRVLTYEACTITTSTTTMTNTLTAQRYIGSGDQGLQICATVQSALGAVAANLSSMTVTDNNGNAAVALSPGFTMAWWTSGTAGTSTTPAIVALPRDNANLRSFAPWLPLPGIGGARKIEAYTSDAINTGTVCLALIKPLATIWNSSFGVVSQLETARSMYTLERIYNDACLSMLLYQGSSATSDAIGRLRAVHS